MKSEKLFLNHNEFVSFWPPPLVWLMIRTWPDAFANVRLECLKLLKLYSADRCKLTWQSKVASRSIPAGYWARVIVHWLVKSLIVVCHVMVKHFNFSGPIVGLHNWYLLNRTRHHFYLRFSCDENVEMENQIKNLKY